MSSFFPGEIGDAIQYTNFGYGAQVPKIVILKCIFVILGHFRHLSVIFQSYFQGLLRF